MNDVTWEPMDREDAMSSVGMGVHTGLRKGTEAPGAHELWVAINDSDAWADAVSYYVETLYDYGFAICKRTVEAAAEGGERHD